jgi:uncharacterized cupin superfamily protein
MLKSVLILGLFIAGTLWGTKSAVAEPLISKISKAEIAGSIFTDKRLVVSNHEGDNGTVETQDVETFLSSNKHFDSGMYKSGPSKYIIEDAYGVDEFMYFLEGSVTLTSTDGSVTEIGPGDAVTIAKEWTGTWESKGYTKIYVIYSRDKPISDE